MNRRAALVTLLGVGMLVAWADSHRAPVASPSPAAATPTATPTVVPPSDPSVRISHELIEVPARRVPSPEPRMPVVSRGRPARQARARSETPPLAERARRFLIGDGQYRPEPFPRPTR